MNINSSVRSVKALAASLFVAASGVLGSWARADVIFKDDFETGDLTHTSSGAKWGSKTNVSVSGAQARTGNYAAQFVFAGNTSLAANADAFAELRFDLGRTTEELWIQFSMYVPTNYQHRNAESSDNNKLFRLWGADYSDAEKIGFSTWPTVDGYSTARADWSRDNGGLGPKGALCDAFITASDLGKWMTIRIHLDAATETQGGTLQLWKNGALVINNDGTVDSYWASNIHAYRYGYLLGWSNSGFTQTTNMYIDDVVFATTEADLEGGANPPSPPHLELKSE